MDKMFETQMDLLRFCSDKGKRDCKMRYKRILAEQKNISPNSKEAIVFYQNEIDKLKTELEFEKQQGKVLFIDSFDSPIWIEVWSNFDKQLRERIFELGNSATRNALFLLCFNELSRSYFYQHLLDLLRKKLSEFQQKINGKERKIILKWNAGENKLIHVFTKLRKVGWIANDEKEILLFLKSHFSCFESNKSEKKIIINWTGKQNQIAHIMWQFRTIPLNESVTYISSSQKDIAKLLKSNFSVFLDKKDEKAVYDVVQKKTNHPAISNQISILYLLK